MLHMGKIQTCPNPQAFVEGMISLFKQIANIKSPHGIDLDQVPCMVTDDQSAYACRETCKMSCTLCRS